METHDDHREDQARADRRWNVSCVVSLFVVVAAVIAAAAWFHNLLKNPQGL